MVLRLEAQVALDVDDDGRGGAPRDLAEHGDVLGDEEELAGRVCEGVVLVLVACMKEKGSKVGL